MRRSRSGRPAARAAFLAVAALLGLVAPAGPTVAGARGSGPDVAAGSAGTIAAIIPTDTANLLDRPIIDVARIGPQAGTPERLLVVLADPERGTVRLELLVDAAGGWLVAGGMDLRPADPADVAVRLVGLPDAETFVVVLGAPAGERTRLVQVAVDGTRLRSGRERSLEGGVAGVGAADVDGDGRHELILASAGRDGATSAEGCGRLETRDVETLAVHEVRTTRAVEGVALADVAEEPGTEVLLVTTPCGGPTARRLEVLRAGQPDPLASVDLAPGGEPLAAPLVGAVPGGGGEPVVVVASGERSIVIDPADAWRTHDLVAGPSRPLGLAAGPDSTTIVIAAMSGGRVADLRRTDLRRTPDGELVIPEADPIGRLQTDIDRWSEARPVSGAGPRWPAGTLLDVDGDGCPELIVPMVVITCAGSASQEERVGPGWVATRPVAVVEGRERRLLVAASLAWSPGDGGLAEPQPWASLADASGGWRWGPSAPFAIAELTAADLLYFRRFPIPTPTVDPDTGADSLRATIAARAGERALVRVREIDPLDLEGTDVRDPDRRSEEFLSGPAATGETIAVVRSPVNVGRRSGVEQGAIRVPLAASRPDLGPGKAWHVEAVTVSDWGEISPPVSGTVSLDTTGPTLTVRAPFLTLPWPFTATITGVSEPGTQVSVPGSPAVEAVRRGGRFDLETRLAPWPQEVRIVAVDRDGNVSVRTVDVVGGIDYRQVPLPAWIGLAALIVIAASVLRRPTVGPAAEPLTPGATSSPESVTGATLSVRASGRRRESTTRVDPPLPAIEDLPVNGA
jgi:hypothetical protein